MTTYTALVRQFWGKPEKQFKLKEFQTVSKEGAWEQAEEECSNTDTQIWILDKEELKALKKVLA